MLFTIGIKSTKVFQLQIYKNPVWFLVMMTIMYHVNKKNEEGAERAFGCRVLTVSR